MRRLLGLRILGLICLLLAWVPCAAQVLTAPKVIPSTYQGLVATKGNIPNAQTSVGAFQSANSVSCHWARDVITSVRVAFADTYVPTNTSAETANGTSITLTASVQYPLTGSHFNQLLFSGASSIVIADNNYVISDSVTLSTTIPVGVKFCVRAHIVVPANTQIPNSNESDNTDDAWNVCTGIVSCSNTGGTPGDLTLGGSLTNNQSGFFPALGIIAATKQPTLVIAGDSIAAGVGGAGFDTQGNSGPAARALGPSFGYSKYAVSGNVMQGWINGNQSPIRRAMFAFASHVVICLGTNDFNSISFASSGFGNAQTMWGWAHAAGAKAIHATVAPRTIPGPWVNPPSNQTTTYIGGLTGFWKTFNDAIRAGTAGLDGFFDPAAQVEFNAIDSGIWDVGSGNSTLTTDGTHPNVAGTAKMIQGYNPSKIHIP